MTESLGAQSAQTADVRASVLERERDELREALQDVLLGSLLDVRRAAFAPKIGVRYTEAIRLDIAAALRRLEDDARYALEKVGS